MEKRYRTYLRLNLLSLFFLIISFLSITLAWFAYSGIAKADTDIKVKSWYIEFQKDNKKVSNEIVLSFEVYPGMETIDEKINIKNFGDSDAQVKYNIQSARIFNNEINSSNLEKDLLEDQLSHNYPFHVNINLSKGYVKANNKDGESELSVSVSWPLDSDNDTTDSNWGTEAFNFQKEEENKAKNDSNYQIKPSIKIVISLKAEQYLTDNNAIDMTYNLGDTIFFDVKNNKRCSKLSNDCIKTTIIDINNKIGNPHVLLLPDLFNEYNIGNYNQIETLLNNNWSVSTRPLDMHDLLKIISTDITNSMLIRKDLSNKIIGNMNYINRIDEEIKTLKEKDGSYEFLISKFPFLSTSKCYWINEDINNEYAYKIVNKNKDYSNIVKELKNNNCSIIPVIIASKQNLNT